jgi:preprotein translocase subunit SecG
MANFLIGTLVVFHFLVGIFLVLIVLMQRTKEGGMGAAFGAGVTESLFGASSGNVLTRITVWTAAIFFVTSLSLAVVFSRSGSSSIGRGALQQVPSLQPAQPAGTLTPQGTATPQGTETAPAPAGSEPLPPQPAPKPSEDGTQSPPPQSHVPKELQQPPSAQGTATADTAPPTPPALPPSLPQPDAPKVNP